MELTEQQAQSIETAAADLDNATILETLGRAIADNGSLLEEYAYLMGRAAYYKEHGNALLKGTLQEE